MNVLGRELKMLRTGTILWVVALCGIVLMYISLYPTFSSDADLTRKLFDNFPPAFRAAFGIDVEAMLSFLGFFAFTFTNLTLFASIHAMHTGVSILSRESRSKTTDFLFSKPRSRTNIFMQKYVAGIVVVLITWVIVTVAAFSFAKAFGAGDFDLGRFAQLMGALLMLQLWFFACGMLAAQLRPRLKSTIPITLAVTFGFFMLSTLGAILGDEKFRYVSPFKFFDYMRIVTGNGYELVYVLIVAGSFAAMLIATYMLYTKRDTKAVA